MIKMHNENYINCENIVNTQIYTKKARCKNTENIILKQTFV